MFRNQGFIFKEDGRTYRYGMPTV